MQQIFDASFKTQPIISANTGSAMPVDMRELTSDELEQVSGGALPLIPLVVPAVKWGGAIFGGSFLAKAGSELYNDMFGPDEMCSM